MASAADPNTALFASGREFTLEGKKGGRDTPAETFTVGAGSTVQDLMSFYQDTLGIDTTVPDDGNPATPTPGAALEPTAPGATTVRFVVSGNTGVDNALGLSAASFTDNNNGAAPLAFTDGPNAAGVPSSPTGESVQTSLIAYDSLGSQVTVDVTAVLESKSDAGNTWRFYTTSADDSDPDKVLGSGTLTFDSQGKLKEATGDTIGINRDGTGAESPLTVKLDFSSMTALASDKSSLVMTQQDGSKIGTLTNFGVGMDGKVLGTFSNGLTRTLGQVAVATFANNAGLVDRGGNQYTAGGNSGVPVVSAPQELGAGSITSGALEQSNVDLSKEFVNLIISSTGFSAASRVISTSDQLITELLNSTR